MAKKILLIPKGYLGDVLLTTPVIAAIKRSDPGASILVMCTPSTAEFARRDPLVDEVLVVDRKAAGRGWSALKAAAHMIRTKNVDRAFSFHRSPRTALILWLSGIKERVAFSDTFLSRLYTHRVQRPVGGHDVVRNLSLLKPFLSEVQQAEIEQIESSSVDANSWADVRVGEPSHDALSARVLGILKRGPYIVLSPGSAWETKRWDAKAFREVAQAVLAHGTHVVVVGAPQDREACEIVAHELPVDNVCGETSLDDLVAVIKGARCVVCNDSLALHICSAAKTPVVAIFCATSPTFGFGPWRNRSVVVEKRGLFCKPCHRHGSRVCPTGTRLCMTGINTSEVICAVSGFLGEQVSTGMQSTLRVVTPS